MLTPPTLAIYAQIRNTKTTINNPIEVIMRHMISALFSPMAFALGFLWPLSWQVVATLELAQAGLPAIVAGAAVAIPLGLMAQFRRSWIWLK
jgi:hypothetical protein